MIERLGPDLTEADIESLAVLLLDAVAGNASVGFPSGLTHAESRAFWVDVAAAVRAGRVILLAARVDGNIAGTVQLVFSQYPNGRVRAEVAKLLVYTSMRRRGVGADLMRAAEDEARKASRSLLVLDTETGSAAEELYRKLGWTLAGVIPDFAYRPDGELRPTSFYYKKLTPG
jgi:GNAT superfamily N-acetyltransferase